MHRLFCKQALNRWTLVALAIGSIMLPVASAQTSTPAHTSHKTKSSTSSGASTSTPTSSSNHTSPSNHSSSRKSAHSGKSSSHRGASKVKGQAAPSPERVNEIQQALAKNGSFTDTASGKWDDSTVDAMKKFQSAHGLNPSGKIDALTLQKLGLGSETAGMGAPNIPPNSAANRLLSRSSSPSSQPE
jgi:murein L,D-transpeptidase YcbB/YkuD